jgi:hypothetical protein
MSHIEKRKSKKAPKSDRVKDLDHLESYDVSSDKDHKTTIHVEPLDSHPPPQPRENRLPNNGLEDS